MRRRSALHEAQQRKPLAVRPAAAAVLIALGAELLILSAASLPGLVGLGAVKWRINTGSAAGDLTAFIITAVLLAGVFAGAVVLAWRLLSRPESSVRAEGAALLAVTIPLLHLGLAQVLTRLVGWYNGTPRPSYAPDWAARIWQLRYTGFALVPGVTFLIAGLVVWLSRASGRRLARLVLVAAAVQSVMLGVLYVMSQPLYVVKWQIKLSRDPSFSLELMIAWVTAELIVVQIASLRTADLIFAATAKWRRIAATVVSMAMWLWGLWSCHYVYSFAIMRASIRRSYWSRGGRTALWKPWYPFVAAGVMLAGALLLTVLARKRDADGSDAEGEDKDEGDGRRAPAPEAPPDE